MNPGPLRNDTRCAGYAVHAPTYGSGSKAGQAPLLCWPVVGGGEGAVAIQCRRLLRPSASSAAWRIVFRTSSGIGPDRWARGRIKAPMAA